MRIKRALILSELFVILILLGLFLIPYVKINEMQKVINADFFSVDKVTVASGTTGKHYDITGEKNLHDFFNIFKGAKLRKSFNQQNRTGFTYSAVLYKSGKRLGSFDFGYNQVSVFRDGKSVRYISNINIGKSEITKIASIYQLS